jgi:hypothetical protein
MVNSLGNEDSGPDHRKTRQPGAHIDILNKNDEPLAGAYDTPSTLAAEDEGISEHEMEAQMADINEYIRWHENTVEYIAQLNRNCPKPTIPEADGIDDLLMKCTKGEQPTQTELDAVYSRIVKANLEEESDVSQKRTRIRHRGGGRRARRRYIYARTQEMYNKHPKRLAKLIRDGVSHYEQGSPCLLTAHEVSNYFVKLWSEPSCQSVALGGKELGISLSDTLPPITRHEVKKRLSFIKADTAAGLDNIGRKHLLRPGVDLMLTKLFNLVLMMAITPTDWKANRTTLILKEGKDKKAVESYRPLTISSLISRIFWGLIDKKIRNVTRLTPRQKGFMPESGLFNNVHILNEAIKL